MFGEGAEHSTRGRVRSLDAKHIRRTAGRGCSGLTALAAAQIPRRRTLSIFRLAWTALIRKRSVNLPYAAHEMNEKRAEHRARPETGTPAEWLAEFDAAARRSLETRFRYAFIIPTNLCSTTRRSAPLIRRRITAAGARKTCRTGWAMAAFEYRQAQEIRDCFQRRGVRYLFLGKSGAILLGFSDTTQDADLFVTMNADLFVFVHTGLAERRPERRLQLLGRRSRFLARHIPG